MIVLSWFSCRGTIDLDVQEFVGATGRQAYCEHYPPSQYSPEPAEVRYDQELNAPGSPEGWDKLYETKTGGWFVAREEGFVVCEPTLLEARSRAFQVMNALHEFEAADALARLAKE